jgi:hypothetical protein
MKVGKLVKRSDPPISVEDKYDSRGRAPVFSEPRKKDRV